MQINFVVAKLMAVVVITLDFASDDADLGSMTIWLFSLVIGLMGLVYLNNEVPPHVSLASCISSHLLGP